MANLSRDSHGHDLGETRGVKSEETSDLTRCDVTASLGHHSNTPLGVGSLKCIDVMDKRRLWSDFEVANYGISLKQYYITINNNKQRIPIRCLVCTFPHK